MNHPIKIPCKIKIKLLPSFLIPPQPKMQSGEYIIVYGLSDHIKIQLWPNIYTSTVLSTFSMCGQNYKSVDFPYAPELCVVILLKEGLLNYAWGMIIWFVLASILRFKFCFCVVMYILPCQRLWYNPAQH